LGQKRKCLLVVSTDLSHYHGSEEAGKMDKLVISYISNLDSRGLYAAAEAKKTEACGLLPLVTGLLYAKEVGCREARIFKYATSGEASGDYAKVVGYVSAAIYKEDNAVKTDKGEVAMLDQKQRKRLLEIARNSISTYLKTGGRLELTEKDPKLLAAGGAFVTLHERGELRGCIGNLIGTEPLYLTVRDMAQEAAVGDPRFEPVKVAELSSIEIEISVLSPMQRVVSVDEIELGTHGVLIKRDLRSGVFLPQVATETGWSKEEFLSTLCSQKAGLPPDAWKDKDTQIYVFSAEVFSESELKSDE
jgi:AmmeMemoRadiSam system protein A